LKNLRIIVIHPNCLKYSFQLSFSSYIWGTCRQPLCGDPWKLRCNQLKKIFTAFHVITNKWTLNFVSSWNGLSKECERKSCTASCLEYTHSFHKIILIHKYITII